LVSSFPSLTFPNHLTIVTGQTPDHHGIVHNTMTDPGIAQRFSLGSREAVENPSWWQEAQAIWVTLREQGKIASTMFWPGSETVIQGVRPNDWLSYEHNMPHRARIETLLGWLSRPPAQRPDLATLYFSDVDSAGHASGPDSDAVNAALRKVDDSIGQLVDELKQRGLFDQTTWVIVSDHGMALAPPQQVIVAPSLLARFPAARWEWLGTTAGGAHHARGHLVVCDEGVVAQVQLLHALAGVLGVLHVLRLGATRRQQRHAPQRARPQTQRCDRRGGTAVQPRGSATGAQRAAPRRRHAAAP
jgi:hypothetical protein